LESEQDQTDKFTLTSALKPAALTMVLAAGITGFTVDSLTLGPLVGLSTSTWSVLSIISLSILCASLVHALWRTRPKAETGRSGLGYASCLVVIAVSALLVGILVDSGSPTRANITNPRGTSPNVVDVSGTVSSLAPGDTLWIFVKWSGGEENHLQWGPCAVTGDHDEDWKCDGVTVGLKDKDVEGEFTLLLTAAKGRKARSFAEALYSSATNPLALSSKQLFEGVVELDRVTVTRK